jgi:hypothetical protein
MPETKERYGQQLVALALNMLTQRVPVPNDVFYQASTDTPSNLKQHYDREMQPAKQLEQTDPLLSSSN